MPRERVLHAAALLRSSNTAASTPEADASRWANSWKRMGDYEKRVVFPPIEEAWPDEETETITPPPGFEARKQ